MMGTDHLRIGTNSTSGYVTMMTGSTREEKRRRLLQLAGARINIDVAGAPTLLLGLPGPFPSPGMERPGADAFVSLNGTQIRGDKNMRDALGIRPAVELIGRAETSVPGWMWSGLGNIAMNQYCLAWQDGQLYYSLQDASLLASGWEFDACVWIKNARWEVRFERVRFAPNGSAWEPSIDGKPVPGARLIVTGQRLAERGKAIDPAEDANSRYALSYVDKRHLISGAYTRLIDRRTRATAVSEDGEPLRRDFGLDQILEEPKLLKDAIEGGIVPLQLALRDVDGTWYDVGRDDLTAALAEKSYKPCADSAELLSRHRSGEGGLFHIDSITGVCRLVYRRSLYPLHFLAARRNGDSVLIDAAVGGSSNVAGCTVAALANDLITCGYPEALLLDNGGDVVLVHRALDRSEGWAEPDGPCAIVPSSLKRYQWSALMLYQGQTDAGIEVARDAVGQDGRFYIEWR